MSDEPFWRLFSDHKVGVWPVDEDAWRTVGDRVSPIFDPGPVQNWPTLHLEIRGHDSFVDVVASVDGYDLWSSQVRDLVEAHLTEVDAVQWLPVQVSDAAHAQTRDYWVANPLFGPEALHADTVTGGLSGVIKGVYDRALIGASRILKYPYGSVPVVADVIRRAVEDSTLTGYKFERVPVR